MTGERNPNGKRTLHDFVVTVQQDHFVTVRAVDNDQAAHRALEALSRRWGDGRNPIVTEIEIL